MKKFRDKKIGFVIVVVVVKHARSARVLCVGLSLDPEGRLKVMGSI